MRLSDDALAALAEIEAEARDAADALYAQEWAAWAAAVDAADPEPAGVPDRADEGGGTADYPW